MSTLAANRSRERSSTPSANEIVDESENLRVSLISEQPGIVEFGGPPRVVVSLHVGPSVEVACRRGAARHRVERATTLFREGRLSIGQIALEIGFSHRSHLAMHMHRVLANEMASCGV